MSVTGVLVICHYYESKIITYYCIDSADVRTDVLLGGDFSRVDDDGEPIDYIRTGVETENAETEILSQDGSVMEIRVLTGDKQGVIKTPYNNYKGYKIMDAKGNEYPVIDDEYCKVAFTVPANYDESIRIAFVEPWYWRVSEIISLLAWIGLVCYYFFAWEVRKGETVS